MHNMKDVPHFPIWQACICGSSAVANKSMAPTATRFIFFKDVHLSCVSNASWISLHSTCMGEALPSGMPHILLSLQIHQGLCSIMETDRGIHFAACGSHTHDRQHTSHKSRSHRQPDIHALKPLSKRAVFLA